MSIYVDPIVVRVSKRPRARFAGRKFGHRWAHLFADSKEELHLAAHNLGLKVEWFQDHPTFPHYDISPRTRALAVEMGARELPTKTILLQMELKRIHQAAHKDHGKGVNISTTGSDIEELGCHCRGTNKQLICAQAGCGFCKAGTKFDEDLKARAP